MSPVLIPERMQALARDPRGYPIPFGLLIDPDGKAHFSLNDESKRLQILRRDLCSICGTKLFRGRWFVGGVLSAFHADGAFIDPPMHAECARYALQACPYLAAPRYAATGDIGRKQLAAAQKSIQQATGANLIGVDRTLIPGRPADDVFVAIMATGQLIFDNLNMRPKRPYSRVEFWRHGAQIPDAEGQETVRKAIAARPEL